MNTLCITGGSDKLLADIEQLFNQAGMAQPDGITREKPLDLKTWHQRVVPIVRSQKLLGRMWETLATDLLLVNLDKPLWGWACRESAELLEFWAELEPGIRFILLCTSPEKKLTQLIAENGGAQGADKWAQCWLEEHKAKLDFYLKYPNRCLMVDSELAFSQPKALIELAHNKWSLPLENDIGSDTAADDANHLASDFLGEYLAKQLIRNLPAGLYQAIEQAYQEISATLHPLGISAGTEGAASTQLEQAIEQYRLLLSEPPETTSQNLMSAASATGLSENLTSSYSQEESITAQSRVNELTQQQEEAQQENELLLLQLHQVQEELEHYYLQHQQQVKENEQLLIRVEKLKRNAGGTIAGNVMIEPCKVGFGVELNWKFTDFDLAGDELAQTSFTTFIKSGQLGIRLNQDKSGELISHWPEVVDRDCPLIVHPSSLSILDSLNGTDYRRLIQLPPLLEKALGKSSLSEREQRRWHKALKRLTLAFQKLPLRLNYDGISLCYEQVNPDYEHLFVTLKSPSFGNRSVQEWNFRISCANVRPGDFGSQPKLELPEQSEQLLYNWFAESESEHGRKLELRFALPNAMDMGVWNRLSIDDQALLRTLVQQLPAMVNELREQDRGISRNWEDWQQLVADMQRVLNTKLKR